VEATVFSDEVIDFSTKALWQARKPYPAASLSLSFFFETKLYLSLSQGISLHDYSIRPLLFVVLISVSQL
jgi:hypothetical protein